MDHHEVAALRFVRAITNSPETAEDALQETFLAAWRAAASFRGAKSARG
ncbi:MAG: sigma factor [Gammaproteobacteria bacterium]|nr:sigma factor [Gammaproteobacteria bacterium]